MKMSELLRNSKNLFQMIYFSGDRSEGATEELEAAKRDVSEGATEELDAAKRAVSEGATEELDYFNFKGIYAVFINTELKDYKSKVKL